jgi:YYY domain-containing protein
LGPVLLLLMANLEGALEVLHNNGLLPLSFWRWLGIRDLMNPLQGPSFLPSDPPDTWWWWRASRVVGTFDPATGVASDYTINEFPFFSFLLGDMHPHVMALPFVLLVVGLALAVAVERGDAAAGADLSRPSPRLLTIGLVVGALGFLNAWDLPTGLALVICGLLVRQVSLGARLDGGLVWRILAPAGLLLAMAALAYLPFYLGLRSQVQGLGLVQVRTQVQHLVVFWGPLLFIGASYPIMRLLPARSARSGGRTLAVFAIAVIGGVALAALGAPSLGLLVALLVVFGAAVFRIVVEQAPAVGQEVKSARLFVLLLGAAAVGLIALCEIVFLRDFFGNRMNTVFKLYYQAWVLLALASAYTIYCAHSCRHSIARPRSSRLLAGVWGALVVVLLVAGFAYTVAAPLSKAQGFSGQPTLDGLAWLRHSNPHERAAIAWLQSVPGTPTILEASGREYSQDNQASAFSGLPALLGWEGHQYQWRGRIPEPAQRKADIDAIFQTTDITQARHLLEKYGISYVYVGEAEKRIYSQAPVGALNKFGRFMDVAYHNDRVTIYRWRETG